MLAVLPLLLILSFLSFECCHAGILKPTLDVSGLADINMTNMKGIVDSNISDGFEKREGKHLHFLLF